MSQQEQRPPGKGGSASDVVGHGEPRSAVPAAGKRTLVEGLSSGVQRVAAADDAAQVAAGAALGGPRAARKPVAMDRARYRAIELQLKNLIAQKRSLVEGAAKADLAGIDAAIDQL